MQIRHSDTCEPWGYVAPIVATVMTRATGVRHIYLIDKNNQIFEFKDPLFLPEAGSQKRVWICMDLYGSVRMSMDLQNLGPSKKYKMLIFSCVCRNYDSASC